ncbi:hypothetical protein L6164_014524 [Bauhinia variegata]|uniref:Uncharacterized protein n=1 Tax=Bauhinia variegata TaxID=167791 RepID=A0ACB9NJK8_BAUVA|nr:hypothetical protein L6164_014524 [Bauhinia variegata]
MFKKSSSHFICQLKIAEDNSGNQLGNCHQIQTAMNSKNFDLGNHAYRSLLPNSKSNYKRKSELVHPTHLHLRNFLTQMSNNSRSDSDTSSDVEELLRIGTRCRELRSEKDMLKSSQYQSFELIRMLELREKSISEAQTEDKRHIERLEKELQNCSQEIDYLRDQLNMRNSEVNYLVEHVRSLKLKLEETENLQPEVYKLREELQRSKSDEFFLIQELETKEMELQNSTFSIEKLEESISAMALESQCEVESMKLDMMALEQSSFEAKKIQEETLQEKIRMSRLNEELQILFQDAQETIISLNEENMELKEKLNISKTNAKLFSEKVEEWLEQKDGSQSKCQSSLSEQACNPTISENISAYGEVLGPLLARLETVLKSDSCLNGEMEKMSSQMQEYEFLVEKLKEELKQEKLKAKEEAEDLAQEMAELRYQVTGLLEEECKRRACIEQASLQRIAELEAQLQSEQRRKPLVSVRHLPEA